jgi:glycosyltransferase involved in cell wall biosynthesis
MADGIRVNLIWMPFTVIDIFMSTRLRYKPLVRQQFFRSICWQFKDYDLLVAHSSYAVPIAYNIKKMYDIPYCAIWHGSDIHTDPFNNKYIFSLTSEIIKAAKVNFFVSKKLLETSELICKTNNKIVLYNGVGENFYRFDDEIRQKLKVDLGINLQNKVVGFAGNLIPIKNATLLPELFHYIETKYNAPLTFVVVGDGKLRAQVESQAKATLTDCIFLGDYPSEKMPEIMNCIDVLVLPSKNEGLPLATLEALACGANVVGSDVGGIKEVLGNDNVVELDENFIQKFSNRVVELLQTKTLTPQVPSQFDWEVTTEIEASTYATILASKQ